MLRQGDLNKLSTASWADIGLLLRAFVLLGLARAAIALVPLRGIVRVLGMSPVKRPDCGTDASSEDPEKFQIPLDAHRTQAAKIGWAVRSAAARTPWQSACLSQALAGSVLLRTREIPFTLNLGVAGNIDSGISAHAWLTCGELTLTGSAGVEEFRTVAAFSRSPDSQVR